MIRLFVAALAALVTLSACVPIVQQAGSPGAAFQGPRLEAEDFISFDGARLAMKHWNPDGDQPWAVIVGLHGMNDYSNAFHLAAPVWAADGIATYAYDQRGFGASPGRGIWGGDGLMTEDLRTFTALIRQRYPHAIIAVAGVSMGGSVAIEAFGSARPPAADRLVLLAPGVWGWSNQPIPYATALWITAHLARSAVLNPPDFLVDKVQPTDNHDELVRMGRDRMLIFGARTDTLYGVVGAMERAQKSMGRLAVPTAYLAGAHDKIIPKAPMMRAARRLKSTDRSAYYANGYHLLLVDRQAQVVYRDVESFIRDPAAPLPSGAPTIPGAPTAANARMARSGQ
ncbi:MAG TPA: alpha/beta fold hydrolase [Caulobacteraceae bacterium]|jgi:alpha-beta hydrolase superfamily lysophospholipase|nr:alpha/beta fold hydrolase [Caulobacteraceae bacterium]